MAGQGVSPVFESRRRFIAGADAINLAEQKVAALHADIDAYRTGLRRSPLTTARDRVAEA